MCGIWGCTKSKQIPDESSPHPVTTRLETLFNTPIGIKVLVATPTAESNPQKSTEGLSAKLLNFP